MRIGFTELLVVFIVALVVIGPDKLPQYARKFGTALAAFRKASDEATGEIRRNIVEPLEEAQRPLREAMEPLEELNNTVTEHVRDVQTSLNRIGRTPKQSGKQTVKPEEKQSVPETPENSAMKTESSIPDTPEDSAPDVGVSAQGTPEDSTGEELKQEGNHETGNE